MLNSRLLTLPLLLLLFFFFFKTEVALGQQPVITPKSNIVLTLDATGNYAVNLSDVATVTVGATTIITPSAFTCADIGSKSVTVEAYNPSPARFYYPAGMIYDALGNLYIVDRDNHCVRKLMPNGNVTTVAGTGADGHVNGKGTAASFGDINDIVLDSQGDLYVNDYKYADIRKIAPDGTVTTFASNIPCNQMVMDKLDNMFVTTINACVKKITPDGVVSYFAGIEANGYLDATGTDARFSFVDGITIDAFGNLYVLDYGNYKIRKITPNAVVTTLPVTGGFVPQGYLVLDANDNLFVASSDAIWERKANGECVAFAGSNVPAGNGNNDGTGAAARFNTVQGIVIDASGNFLVADAGDDAIRMITAAAVVTTYAGGTQGYANGTIKHGPSVFLQIPVTVEAPSTLVPSVKITPDSYGGCEGQSLTYTAIPTDAGDNPAYQWKVNGLNAGTNSTEFTSSTLKTGDKITCTITSSAACSIATAISNEASLIADPTVSNSISITSSAVNNIITPGQQVTFTAQAAITDNVVYQWLVNNVNAGDNNPVFTTNSLLNGDVVTCSVTTYGKCIATPYVVSNALTMTIYVPVEIVNTFTPNGDGINDTWEIPSLQAYPACSVNIFTRYGAIVYKSIGYAKAWDGTYAAKQVPVGTYYYIIDLKNGKDKISGAVTVLR
jgi:gliding motility-associated-like protein